MSKNLGRLYGIADEKWIPFDKFEWYVEEAIKGGVDMLQLRIKTDKEILLKLGKRIIPIIREYHIPLIINDYPEIAKELGTDGVHVGKGDIHPLEARRIIGKDKILGVSVYRDIELAKELETIADYLSFSSPFSSLTKEKDKVCMDLHRKAVKLFKKPIYVIGGITAENATELLKLGIYGIAVSSYIFNTPYPRERANKLSNLLKIKSLT